MDQELILEDMYLQFEEGSIKTGLGRSKHQLLMITKVI